MKLDYKQLTELIGIINESSVSQFELNTENVYFKISKGAVGDAVLSIPKKPLAAAAPEQEQNQTTAAGNYITAPLAGTLRLSATKGRKPIVSIGSKVKLGDVVCVINTETAVNEILSQYDGIIAEVLAENEASVEYGQKLFRVV